MNAGGFVFSLTDVKFSVCGLKLVLVEKLKHSIVAINPFKSC